MEKNTTIGTFINNSPLNSDNNGGKMEHFEDAFRKWEEEKEKEYKELFSDEEKLREKALESVFVDSYKKGKRIVTKGVFIRIKPKLFGIVPDNRVSVYIEKDDIVVEGNNPNGNKESVRIGKETLEGWKKERFPENVNSYQVVKTEYDNRGNDKYEGPYLDIILKEDLFVVKVPDFDLEKRSVYIRGDKLLMRGVQKEKIGTSRPCIDIGKICYLPNLEEYFIKECKEDNKESAVYITLKKKTVLDAAELRLWNGGG